MLDVTLTALEQEGLKRSIIKTLTYADVFDYPLTLHEIHRYLVEEHATVEQVHEGLSAGDFVSQNIVEKSIYYALPGRDQIIETRLNRSKIAFGLWPAAIKYGAMMARLPFVRMVAVTGSLAVDNESTNDIDYLIVTKPGRLWLCRAMVILVVRWARLQGVEVCLIAAAGGGRSQVAHSRELRDIESVVAGKVDSRGSDGRDAARIQIDPNQRVGHVIQSEPPSS